MWNLNFNIRALEKKRELIIIKKQIKPSLRPINKFNSLNTFSVSMYVILIKRKEK